MITIQKVREIGMNEELKKLLCSVLKEDVYSNRFVELIIKRRNGLTEQESLELKDKCQEIIDDINWELQLSSSHYSIGNWTLNKEQIKKIIKTEPRKIRESNVINGICLPEKEELNIANEILKKRKNQQDLKGDYHD
jgi:hypothetical protein